jgi:phenylacetate-CoA ligase
MSEPASSTVIDPDRYWDADAETASRAELAARHEEQLVELVHHAYEHSALYQKLWSDAGVHPRDIRSTADFCERIPFIDKDTIRAFRDRHGDPYGGLLCVPESELTAVNSTSGTTGDPTLVPEQWAGGLGGPGLSRDFWEMGVRPGDHVLVPMFTFRGPIFNFPHALGAVPLICDHSPLELPRMVELIRKYRPVNQYTMSGPLLIAWAEYEQRTGDDMAELFSSFHGAVFGGEPPGSRARANTERWGVPLFEHSSAGDVGAAFECREHDGLHVWEDVGFYECIDPEATSPANATPTPDGEIGELVATALTNRVFPLIRYRSDDIDRFTRQRCRCGRTHARLWTLGRKGDETVVDGRSVLPRDVWAAVEALDECAAGLFQIIRPSRQLDALRLRVGYAGNPRSLPELAERVADSVEASAGVRPEVELVPNGELLKLGPPHKIPRVTKR